MKKLKSLKDITRNVFDNVKIIRIASFNVNYLLLSIILFWITHHMLSIIYKSNSLEVSEAWFDAYLWNRYEMIMSIQYENVCYSFY